jgi:hypothetical protein
LPFARTGQRHLRWLNACYVDVDCHRLGIDLGDAYAWIAAILTVTVPVFESTLPSFASSGWRAQRPAHRR